MTILAEIDLETIGKAFKEHGVIWAVVVAVLMIFWFVWHEVLDDPFKDHWFRRHIKRRILKKQFIEDLVSETFEGKAEWVTEEHFKKRASKERILQFYGGAKLDWDIIAANGDISRDQRPELEKLLAQPSVGTRLLCVTADAGAGKSTIAWRATADFVRKSTNTIILHIFAAGEVDVWQRMPDFQRELGRPLLVLVDDLFRDQEAANAFIDLAPNLSLVVLATSRLNEFHSRAKRLKCECTQFQLSPPSAKEKERVLSNLGKGRADLTADQTRRLDHANQFIVLMIELVGGKDLHEVIRDSINTLYDLEPNHSTYRAYGYLCFAGQVSVSIPTSLLEKVHREFAGLAGRPVVEGLIFADDQHKFLRAGHPVLASTASNIYISEKGYNPNQIIGDLFSAIDHSIAAERCFAGFLLKALATAQLSSAESLVALAKSFYAQSESIQELMCWRSFYLRCSRPDLAEKCAELAIKRELTSQDDCNMLLYLYRERGREKDALQPIAKCIKDYPNEGAGRVSYLGLVEKYARSEIPNVIREMDQWLDANPSDTYVRIRFLLFVEKNQKESLKHQIQKCESWLQGQHLAESAVRAAYLGILERNGTEGEIETAIAKAWQWLEKPENKIDVDTRKAFLGLIRRSWAIHRQKISDSDEWLQKKASLRVLLLSITFLKKAFNGLSNILKLGIFGALSWAYFFPSDAKMRR